MKAAVVCDANAQAAAEEPADYENRLASIEGKLTVLIRAVGTNPTAALATFGPADPTRTAIFKPKR